MAVWHCLVGLLAKTVAAWERVKWQILSESSELSETAAVQLLGFLSCDRLLTGVVDLNLLIDCIQDCLHFIFQAIQLPGFSFQDLLIFLIVLFKLCMQNNNKTRSELQGNKTMNAFLDHYVQWGKKVFSQPPIVQVLPLKKMREACNFHHRYTSTMRDKIRKKIQKITL